MSEDAFAGIAQTNLAKRRRGSSSSSESEGDFLPPADSTRTWFESADWSDLTIELADGRKIPAHKVVLCTRNKYFNALCGLNSQFAEGQQKEIKLEDDDPDALRAVIRKIYGWPTGAHDEHPWVYWFNLAKTADKYLAKELVFEAAGAMLECGFHKAKHTIPRDIAGVCDILEGISEINSEVEETCAYRLARSIPTEIVSNRRVRSYLLSHPQVMLKLVERHSWKQILRNQRTRAPRAPLNPGVQIMSVADMRDMM